MSKFSTKFILQFIIDFLFIGIGASLLLKISTAVIVDTLSMSFIPACFLSILLGCALNVLTVILAVFSTQKYISKKSLCDYPDDPKRFYVKFAVIITVIDVLYSALNLLYTYKTNTGITAMMIIVPVIVLVIGNIAQAAVLFSCVRVFQSRHERFFI
ncbi:MAG: hypothetical protein Q4F95_00360 [Oscillospiraceae bacterium]|nr:hypothetical protein [Oscillospiraceae bacterium]